MLFRLNLTVSALTVLPVKNIRNPISHYHRTRIGIISISEAILIKDSVRMTSTKATRFLRKVKWLSTRGMKLGEKNQAWSKVYLAFSNRLRTTLRKDSKNTLAREPISAYRMDHYLRLWSQWLRKSFLWSSMCLILTNKPILSTTLEKFILTSSWLKCLMFSSGAMD